MSKIQLSGVAKRNVVQFDRSKHIFTNGEDNAYPQKVERLIQNSVTADACVKKATSFIVGDGFILLTSASPLYVTPKENPPCITTSLDIFCKISYIVYSRKPSLYTIFSFSVLSTKPSPTINEVAFFTQASAVTLFCIRRSTFCG